MTPEALLKVQAETIGRLLEGDDLVARMVRGKRIDGVARWMPLTVARLQGAGWLDRVFHSFLSTREGEATDPFSDARAFEAWLCAHPVNMDGLDEALEEDSARIRLLAPDARPWGACARGTRVFYRVGREVRELRWRRGARVADGG